MACAILLHDMVCRAGPSLAADAMRARYAARLSLLQMQSDVSRLNVELTSGRHADVGLTLGRLTETNAIELLKICVFDLSEASRQLDRFRLNPGYQLCYCYGNYEFKQLKKNYGDRLKGKDFHNFLLEGGEIPFHLIARRLKNHD